MESGNSGSGGRRPLSWSSLGDGGRSRLTDNSRDRLGRKGSDGPSWSKQPLVGASTVAAEVGEEEEVQSPLKNQPPPKASDTIVKKKLLLEDTVKQEVVGGGDTMQVQIPEDHPTDPPTKTGVQESGGGKEKAVKKDKVRKEKEGKKRTYKRQLRIKESDGKEQSLANLEKKRGASDMDVDTKEVNKRARRDGEVGEVRSNNLNAGSHGRSCEQK